ncbi:acyl transferase/acyl hydrolase/lysophospholipase [Parasitella parasitica]|nr:acyl transferase/acyl hydrolase/lysophospholipase [Parasitella parasitica]
MQPWLTLLENLYALIKCAILLSFSKRSRSTSYHKKDSYLEYFQKKLDSAKSYKEWSQAALALDDLTGANEWKNLPVSKDYDYKLLQSRISEINQVRSSGQNRRAMTFALRLSLSRNLGDMGNSALFEHSCIGTKKLISDYIDHIIEQLQWIGDTTAPTTDMDFKQRHDYFMNLRHSYGRTALLLSGGGTLGFFHVGVLKTLINARLLPRILSGASTGSIMASIICTLNEQDRITMFNDNNSIPVNVFSHPDIPESLLFRFNRYLLSGSFYDPVFLKEALREQYGDITFSEAYNRSQLILNIAVSSTSIYEMPRLLNYITAPDVVVWSAVIISCAVPMVYPDGYLYVKDKEGGLKPWTPTDDKYRDGSIDNDLPLKRISEMFSVNHFIVVQINPHVAPYLHKGKGKPTLLRTSINFALRLIKEEFQHRCSQLIEIGVSSNAILRLQSVLSQRYVGDITLSPELTFTDVGKILTNLSRAEAVNFIERGERVAWDHLSKIHHSLKIELAIDAAIYKLRKVLLGESPQIPHELVMATPSLLVSPSSSTYFSRKSPSDFTDHNQNSVSAYENDEEEQDNTDDDDDDDSGYNDVSIIPTPLWQTDHYANNIALLLKNHEKKESKFIRPSLLPHDISRRGSNVSIRDISPSTSMTRFERRKQVTSAQFFIAPEYDWIPESTKSSNISDRKLTVVIPFGCDAIKQ